jgi:hypothetical protein
LPNPAVSRRQVGATVCSVSRGQVRVGNRILIPTNKGDAVAFPGPPGRRRAPRLPEPPMATGVAPPPETLGADEKLSWTEQPLGSSSNVQFHAAGTVEIR